MTLEELKTRCETQGFEYAYGIFKNPVSPPYLVAVTTDSQVFHADDIVYYSKCSVELLYTYKDKDNAEMQKVENNILGDVAWEKSEESYLSDEKIWQITYFFEI